MATKIAGVDLSKWQAEVDYKALKAGAIKGKSVKFAMLRFAYGTAKDALFDKHYAGCKAAGLYVGIYQWSRAKTPAEARAEARWLIEQLGSYELDYPVALDFEDTGVLSAGLTKEQYTDIVLAYLETIKEANYYPILYTGPCVIEQHLNLDRLKAYDLWLAQYTSEGYQRQYGQTMWQFTVAGSRLLDYGKVGAVSGVKGACDCNWSYVGYAAKIKQLGLNKPRTRYVVTATKTVYKEQLEQIKSLLKAQGFSVSSRKL